MTNHEKVAYLMFSEYNNLTVKYDLVAIQSERDLAHMLEDNLDDDQIERLLQDPLARMAFAGYVQGLSVVHESFLNGEVQVISHDVYGDGLVDREVEEVFSSGKKTLKPPH